VEEQVSSNQSDAELKMTEHVVAESKSQEDNTLCLDEVYEYLEEVHEPWVKQEHKTFIIWNLHKFT